MGACLNTRKFPALRASARPCAPNRLAASIGAAFLVAASPLPASTFTVTTNADTGAGSLRATIAAAHADATPPTKVDFAASVTSPITLTTGEIGVTKSMTIQGPGADKLTISGVEGSRILNVNNPSTSALISVAVSGLTLTGANPFANGGAIYAYRTNLSISACVITGNSGYNGGGVYLAGDFSHHLYPNLTIGDSTFSGNIAIKGGGGVSANVTGAVNIDNVTFDQNHAGNGGGGLALHTASDPASSVTLTHSSITNNKGSLAALGGGGGGYIWNFNSSTVDQCVVSGNTSGADGGGLSFPRGSQTITNSTISGNTAVGRGGGIYRFFGPGLTISDSRLLGNTAAKGGGAFVDATPLVMHRTLVSGNTASNGYGGGLSLGWSYYASNLKNALLDTSTFVANSASGAGGGIAIDDEPNSGQQTVLQNLTIAGNSASVGGGIAVNDRSVSPTLSWLTVADNTAATGGGIAVANFLGPVAATAVTPTLHDSIVAKNIATTANPDVSGKFTANFNFFSDTTGATLLGNSGNQTGDPQLGPLGDYGGPTPTKLPKAGSLALDHGDPAPVSPPASDQRGDTRVVNARVDIGADERRGSEDTIFLDSLEGY